MFDLHFLPRKFSLAGYAAQLAITGRGADAINILLDRRLGYEALDWSKRIPGPCRTIIDAGAHFGDVSAALDLVFHPTRLLAVEANPARAAGLRARFRSRPHLQVAALALAEQNSTLPFFLQDFDAASSLFPLRAGYLASLGLADGVRQIEVPARRLDEVAAEAGLVDVDLLKLDCQGAELRILQGAGGLLRRIRCIYTEVTFEPIYTQGALFNEVHAFLRAAGFRLTQLIPGGGAHANIDQGDALYVRTEICE
jgi:FkbM family methyltransferase